MSKDRLAKMLPHKEEFQQQIMKRRADEFADLKVGSQRTLKWSRAGQPSGWPSLSSGNKSGLRPPHSLK